MARRRARKLPRRITSSRFNPLNLRTTAKSEGSRLPKSGLVVRQNRIRQKGWAGFVARLRQWRQNLTWKKVLIYVGGAFAVVLLGVGTLFAIYVRDIPNPKQLSNRPINQSTQILDRNGKPLFSFYGEENRTLLTSEQISDYAKQAAVSVEDANFYNHSGFDVKGIARAVWCRIYPACGRYVGGGSTITQQYVKNALVGDDYSLNRKLRELILSIEVEQIYTKDEILTGYLNEIPYGGAVYGIEAAAQSFFGKSAKDLTLSESATLAAIPQRPTYYSPYGSHLDELFGRKDYILDRMALLGFVTQEEADAAKKDLPNAENPKFATRAGLIAPHFVFYVRQQLIEYINEDPSQAEIKLDQAGYVVTTSLDLETQRLAEAVMTELGPGTIERYRASNAAMVSVDPKTGEILSMVGSVDYENSISGNTNFANALLQPGSSFKPIVYATAFDKEHKKSPASITFDVQTDFGNYVPQNYNGRFRGPITNRDALATSLNIPAVKNLAIVGIPDAIDTANRLGISSLNDETNDYGLSLVLGAGEVRPVEMANAYATFANQGKHFPLRPILKIEKDGQVIKDFTEDAEPTQAIEPQVAYQITDILSDNVARIPTFGARSNLVLPDRPVAAKSGTTDNNRDAWLVGYTPQISTAVWVGNNEPNKTMTAGAGGSMAAGALWQKFMIEYHKGKPVEQFERPDGLREITVDFLSGKLPTDQTPQDQRITDLFAEWQIPTDFDDVHVKVKIDTLSGKLATEFTPPEYIEERTYFSVRSEFPDRSNWEQPVQAWAAANGGGVSPPTEQDDLHTAANMPTIQITSPGNSANVSGVFNVNVTIGGGPIKVKHVEYFIDNVSVGTITASPWSFTYNAANLSPGSHVVKALVVNDYGLKASDQVTVVVSASNDSSPPGAVSSVNLSKGVGAAAVKFTWKNPGDADLSKVFIYRSSVPGTLGSLVHTVSNATPSGTVNVTLSNQPIGTQYYTIRAVDGSGNENQNLTQYSFTVTP